MPPWWSTQRGCGVANPCVCLGCMTRSRCCTTTTPCWTGSQTELDVAMESSFDHSNFIFNHPLSPIVIRTWLCGGQGERVVIEGLCCCNLCLRTVFPCVGGKLDWIELIINMLCWLVPICCPEGCCPCVIQYNLWVKDADQAVYMVR